MDSIIFLIFTVILVHLIVAGIILVNIGKKKNKKPMLVTGWILLGHVPVISFIACIIGSRSSSFAVWMIFFIFPIAVLVGTIVALSYSIILAINGFRNHRTGRIVTGFALFFTTIFIVVTPIVLVSIFGLPIALM